MNEGRAAQRGAQPYKIKNYTKHRAPTLLLPLPHRVRDGFPLLRVEAAYGLGVGAVNHRQRVGRKRDRGRVEQLAPQARKLGVAELPPLVRVESEAGEGVDHQKVLGRSHQQRHRVLGVKVRRLRHRRLPRRRVDAHLRGGGHHQVAVTERHLHHAVALSEVQLLLRAA